MSIRKMLSAGLCALSVILTSGAPGVAQSVRVMQGEAHAPLRVPLNRAVVVESDVVFAELSVANPLIADIATLSERTIYVLGKAPGRTTLTLLGLDGRLITNIEVQVTPDIGEIKERISQLLPGEPIEVRTANDGIVLSGAVSSSQRLQRAMEIANRYAPGLVLNLMVVGGTQQVEIKVRFAEMERDVAKELASSFTAGGSLLDGRIGTNFGATNSVTGTAIGTLGLTFGSGALAFTNTLEALESKGLTRTLAEPNIIALSGESASFHAGGEYPVPVLGESGQISVSYRPFGVELAFTPTVVDGDIINLQMNASVSSISSTNQLTLSGGFTVDSFVTRRTSSTVEMRDGQSFAVAGLLQESFTDGVSQIPWLGDVPILGTLFRSARYNNRQTELVIIVTAHLVNPTSGEALAMPTDRVRLPTEGELFLFGEVAGGLPGQQGVTATSRNASDVSSQDFSGSYGYVME